MIFNFFRYIYEKYLTIILNVVFWLYGTKTNRASFEIFGEKRKNLHRNMGKHMPTAIEWAALIAWFENDLEQIDVTMPLLSDKERFHLAAWCMKNDGYESKVH